MSPTIRHSDVALEDSSRSVIALLLSLTPIYFLQSRVASLGLDKLHWGLLQILLLLVLQKVINYFPSIQRTKRNKVATTTTSTRGAAPPPLPATSSGSASTPATPTTTRIKRTTRRRTSSPPSPTNPLYPPTLLDSTVARFLSSTSPSHLSLLPPHSLPPNTPPSVPLASWKTLHSDPTSSINLLVSQHPTTKSLYAIRASYPPSESGGGGKDLLRRLYEVLTDVGRRKSWDGMCQDAREVERFEVEGGRKGAVAWIGMKGMAIVKPKDMCLLSVAGQLPPLSSDEEDDESSHKDRIRIYCATTSFEHPDEPPRKEFNRMTTSSGFILEEEEGGGCRVTQVTDLSGLGSWVPSAIIRTVTQTLLPKSLTKLGKAAAAFNLDESPYPKEGDDWLPPLLGSATSSSPSPSSDFDEEEEEEDEDDEILAPSSSSSSDTAPLSPSATRDLHSLVNQLRSVTSRLNALEESNSHAPVQKKWYDVLGGGEGGGEQMLMSAKGLGGAAGAAVLLAGLAVWSRRRR